MHLLHHISSECRGLGFLGAGDHGCLTVVMNPYFLNSYKFTNNLRDSPLPLEKGTGFPCACCNELIVSGRNREDLGRILRYSYNSVSTITVKMPLLSNVSSSRQISLAGSNLIN